MEILDFTGTKYLERADTRPTFGGTAASEIGKTGSVALIQFGGQNYTVNIGMDGKFSWTSPVDVADGEYSLSIIIQDRAGNQSSPILRTAIIDTTPPEAPKLLKLTDNVGDIQGSFDESKPTDDKTPTLTGIAQKGATVFLKDEAGSVIGSAVADKESGVWVITPVTELSDGTNNLTLSTQELFAGETRVSAESPLVITVAPDADNGGELPPNTIIITNAWDDAGENTGILNNGALTDDAQPELRGFASAGSTVVIYFREVGSDAWAGSATATLSGQQWSWTPSEALQAGYYEFQASIGDYTSALFSLEIASPDDAARLTRIESAYDNFGNDVGSLGDGAYTDDTTPTLRGRAEANSQIVLRYTMLEGVSGSVTVDVDNRGNWSWTPDSELEIGDWIFEVQASDKATWSKSFSLHISGAEGLLPVIDYVYDDYGYSVGKRVNGSTTDDAKPTVHGHGEANSEIILSYQIAEGTPASVSVRVDENGKWQWTPSEKLQDGKWTFEIQNSQGAKNNSFELTINTELSGGTESYLDFRDVANKNYDNGLIFNIGRFKGNWHDFLSIYKLSENEQGLTITGKKGGTAHVDLELSYKATTAVFLLGAYSPTSNGHINAFDEDNNLIARIPYTYSKTSEYHVIKTQTPFTKLQFIALEGTRVYLFDIELKLTGEPNPNATWLNTSEVNHDESINSTLHMIDANDDDSGYELTQTQSDNSAENNSATTQTDTLTLLGKDQLIDLSVDNAKFEEVKIVDLTGKGDNTLKLDLSALLAHGEQDLLIEDGKTQLVVKGDAGDVVQLKDILPEGSDLSEWQHQDGTVTVAGVEYQVYSHGDDAELLVQQGVKTELI